MHRSPSRRPRPRFFFRVLAACSLAAAAIGFTTACTQSEPEGGTPKSETWYGLAFNSCGEPAITYLVDSVVYSGCSNHHEGVPDLRIEGKLMDALQPGDLIKDTIPGCDKAVCVDGTVVTLEILGTDTTSVTSAFRIESQKDNVRKTLHYGKAVLTKCRGLPICELGE
jgi:hypothetical protein